MNKTNELQRVAIWYIADDQFDDEIENLNSEEKDMVKRLLEDSHIFEGTLTDFAYRYIEDLDLPEYVIFRIDFEGLGADLIHDGYREFEYPPTGVTYVIRYI